MERFYYKNKNQTGFLNLKSPLVDENYIQITEEEYAPIKAQRAELRRQINELEAKL